MILNIHYLASINNINIPSRIYMIQGNHILTMNLKASYIREQLKKFFPATSLQGYKY
ncbi:hypothetical protein HanRHA438_Chr10g0444021 [Helianthus annuus]|nr:hypothetical protein HanRHA438_Chr10g0444021 [Helianthus annuus]